METYDFRELIDKEEILRAVEDMGFEEASPIQAKAIPIMKQGADVIGQAQTGTGKTAAFGIPLLEKVDAESKDLQAVILCPTRELAIQVAEEIRNLAKFMHGVKVLPIYGGQEIVKQIRSLKAGVQIMVGTPGRVMDHMRRKTIRFGNVHTVVLDEADEMLNMGFREDIETILSEMPSERQTVLFSATMPKPILEIAGTYQRDAQLIQVLKKELTVENIDQYYYEVKQRNKDEVLCRLLDVYAPNLSIVFCNTKRKVEELVGVLQGRGYFAEALHGDLKQLQRDRVMQSFRSGSTEILVATDVAARGIDVDDIEAVFNYDLPQDEEYYVHRIGRTGRAGRTGMAFSFVSGREVYKLKDIMRYCKTKIKLEQIPSMYDITQIKAEKTLNKISAIIKEQDLTSMIRLVEARVNEEDYTTLDMAAAFLKMAMGETSADKKDELLIDEARRETRGEDRKNKGGQRRQPRERQSKEGMTRLFINIGKKQSVSRKDFVGAIAGECNISGQNIGNIDIYDKYTFVDVPQQDAKTIIKIMKKAKIRGKAIHIEQAERKR